MAESVKQELDRKLEGAEQALDEATTAMNRYKEEVGILQTRVSNLKIAIRALMPVQNGNPMFDLDKNGVRINYIADHELK